jgi:hypothetical protein
MTVVTVARRYHFQAQHHIPELAGYDEPHWHDYTVEIVVLSDPVRLSDTARLDAWWVRQPDHDGADLNTIYEHTTVEWIAATLLGNAIESFVHPVISVMVREDDEREGRATA